MKLIYYSGILLRTTSLVRLDKTGHVNPSVFELFQCVLHITSLEGTGSAVEPVQLEVEEVVVFAVVPHGEVFVVSVEHPYFTLKARSCSEEKYKYKMLL